LAFSGDASSGAGFPSLDCTPLPTASVPVPGFSTPSASAVVFHPLDIVLWKNISIMVPS
jgi:hypothetical protein